jgi:hypothetical protein
MSVHAQNPTAAVGQDGVGVVEGEVFHDSGEEGEVPRALRRTRGAIRPGAHVRLEPIDEEHLAPEASKAQEVLEKHPGMATALESLGEGTRDHHSHAGVVS